MITQDCLTEMNKNVEQRLNTRRGTVRIHKKAQFIQTRLFYGLQSTDLKQITDCISHKLYYVNFR